MTRRGWLLFAAVAVLWGSPFLLLKVAVDAGTPAAVVAASRVALGAAVLLPVALARGGLHGLGSRERPLLAVAVLDITLPFLLVPTAGLVLIAAGSWTSTSDPPSFRGRRTG